MLGQANIQIICVGKIKEKANRTLIDEYIKRIERYAKIEVIELKDFADNMDAVEKEGQLIKSKVKPGSFVICMAIEGEEFSSEEFAQLIDKKMQTYKRITFIIGGSHGISEDIKSSADLLLSFSPMTFPHQLFRLLLVEQVYRGLSILNNSPYHK